MRPLRAAIRAVLDGNAEAALFTSANQVHTLFQVVAGDSPGGAAQLRDALRRLVVASVGPICSDALREHGVPPDVQPEHPKLGPLVSELSRQANTLLANKDRPTASR
jgi:uroporphyrinogen-III synthase